MTPYQLIRETAEQFAQAGIPDPQVDSAALLSHLTGQPMLNLRLDRYTVLPDETVSRFALLKEKRLARIPLQYILGEQSFLGRSFYVDERVLIPRPETELLTEMAIAHLHRLPAPTALDLCCGSGCIAVSLALEVPSARVEAADLSPGALEVTRRNADALRASITLHQGDLFAAVGDRRYHLIISNPPYIPSTDCLTLQEEVMQEPAMALDGGGDGLDFYRRIAQESPRHLLEGGVVMLEVGFDQGEAVARLMTEAGFSSVSVHEDYQQIPRMVVAHL